MKEYHLIFAGTFLGFVHDVNRALEDGWELQGGVAVCIENGTTKYYQAVVRNKK